MQCRKFALSSLILFFHDFFHQTLYFLIGTLNRITKMSYFVRSTDIYIRFFPGFIRPYRCIQFEDRTGYFFGYNTVDQKQHHNEHDNNDYHINTELFKTVCPGILPDYTDHLPSRISYGTYDHCLLITVFTAHFFIYTVFTCTYNICVFPE